MECYGCGELDGGFVTISLDVRNDVDLSLNEVGPTKRRSAWEANVKVGSVISDPILTYHASGLGHLGWTEHRLY